MPTRPVEVGNRFASGKDAFTVESGVGPTAGMLQVSYSYDLLPILTDANWDGVVIDTLELLVVPARLTGDQGLLFAEGAQVFMTQSVPVGEYPTTRIAAEGSVVLPASFFGFVDMPFVDSHRTWTLLVRTRGSQCIDGTVGSSRVLSSLALHAKVKGLPGPVVLGAPTE
jgi:hypothetical protein